ncbi:unnamed protein product [Callosobruchus maculatus]|uniref:Formin FH3 domain-containing protein n=1 Tax=Callosobruchus maculatus TaxID=64391 RepID=A0A653BFI1_CALMS|nr:unnamed protein product [Callosobruchus maculatus]
MLKKACDPPTNGHTAVAEAMSTLRLRFGEPVRFRFLAGMLTSGCGQKDLVLAGLQFLNAFLSSAGTKQKRLYIQSELEQAGFDICNLARNITQDQSLLEEIRRWEESNIDIEAVYDKLHKCEKEGEKLRAKVVHLEQKIKYLQEEQLALQNSRQTLKDRCNDSTPDDEGISSSERSLTPEDEQGQHSIYTSTFIPGNVAPSVVSRKSEEEEETTIDEVIEELRNIVNDAETASYNEEQAKILEEKRTEEAQVAGKLLSSLDVDDSLVSTECEIVPSNLHPQPPRKVPPPSLVEKNQPIPPQVIKPKTRTTVKRSESFRQVTRTTSRRISCDVYNYSTLIAKHKESSQIPEDCVPGKYKCKSLDRIDDGLEALVDIVVTKEGEQKSRQKSSAYRSKSDSGNASGTSLCRSLSNVFVSPRLEHISKLSTHSEEKQRMFLPTKSDQYEVPYYFPRIQDKKTSTASGFLIKRGHGNAGLYSGQVLLDSRLFMTKEKEIITLSGKINGKLSDFPSGLY